MRSEIKKLHEKLQTTFIYVTHDQTEALTMGDRIVVLDKGVIQQVDEPEKIYYQPANTFVGGFLGAPSMNFVDCDIFDKKIKFNETEIELSQEQLGLIGDRKKVIVGIRPEKMDSLNPNFEFSVKVDISEMLGSEKIVYFDINNLKCSAKIDAQKGFNDTITLKINTNDFLFFDIEKKERL